MSVPADQVQAGLATAIDAGVGAADGLQPAEEAEKQEVKRLTEEYTAARTFDKDARKQYNKDRRYARGGADPDWASDANIIGSLIDILVSFLYAKDPDVSVRPAARAGGQPDKDSTLFAETMQIVISRLWRDAKLKKQMRRMIRSSLSVNVGWVKALVYSETKRNPVVEKQLHDIQDNIAKIQSLQAMLGGPDDPDQEATLLELQRQKEGLAGQVELIVKRGMCIDFCRAEDVQISLDVADTTDYTDADWISNDMYIRKSDLNARFPRLDPETCKRANVYYLRKTEAGRRVHGDDEDGQYTKGMSGSSPASLTVGGDKPVEFAKIVELWDHRDTLIKTFIDGIEKWAVEPYSPPQASNRFYPFFRLALFEVEGERHPQSLIQRLSKLQDEYSSRRSAGRLMRERSIPGTVFHAGQLTPEDVAKFEKSETMEMIGLNPTTPDVDLAKVITAKPIPRVDPMIFDTSDIQRDMDTLSGVQEAQRNAITTQKTATEAELQNAGFNARTGADRDVVEELLGDLAQYSAELAIQSIPLQFAQRIAGMQAFWPEGMDVQDVLTLLDVDISAGSTGKPQARADKEAWATLLPLIQQMMVQIQQLQMVNPQLAQGYRKLLTETLKRLDDRLDIDSIMPMAPMMPQMPGMPGAMPGMPGAMPGAMPPPAVGNGSVNNPQAQKPPTA